MNPELLRLVRLELTPLRLLGTPVLFALWFVFVAGRTRDWTDVAAGAFQATLAAAAFWGARRAADAVAAELRERTWDAQRLSGLGPITMTIGKLFGAPIGAWYVIALSAAVQISVIATLGERPAGDVRLLGFGVSYETVLAQILGAFALFSAAACAATTAHAGQERVRGFDTTLFQALAVGGGALLTSVFIAGSFGAARFTFYGFALSPSAALALAFAFFGAWAAIGFAHQMRKAFGADTTAAPWILFLGALAAFMLGWRDDASIGVAVSLAAAAYVAALIEPHRAVALRQWGADLARLRPRALIEGPAWLYAWLAFAVAVAALLPRIFDSLSEIGAISGRPQIDPVLAPLALLLFVLRDMGVCLWAGLRARDGRGLWTAALVLLALWFVPVSLYNLTGAPELTRLFLPAGGLSAVSAALQAAAAFFAARAVVRLQR